MIATLAEVKTYLGISSSDNDGFLQNQINLVTNAIENYCERIFSSGNYVQTYYRDQFIERAAVVEVPLYHFPLKTITKIVEKFDTPDDGIPVSNYRFHLPTATVTKNCGRFFTDGTLLEVTYTAGYDVIPPVILDTLCSIVQERLNKKLSGVNIDFGSDVQRISIPGTISIDYDYSLQSNERKTAYGHILGNYVNVLDGMRSERAIIGSVRSEYVS